MVLKFPSRRVPHNPKKLTRLSRTGVLTLAHDNFDGVPLGPHACLGFYSFKDASRRADMPLHAAPPHTHDADTPLRFCVCFSRMALLLQHWTGAALAPKTEACSWEDHWYRRALGEHGRDVRRCVKLSKNACLSVIKEIIAAQRVGAFKGVFAVDMTILTSPRAHASARSKHLDAC